MCGNPLAARRRRPARLAISLLVALLAACKGSSPTGPSPGTPTEAYTWVGTLTDNVHGSAALRVVAAGSDGSLIGTWSVETSDGDKGGRALVNLRALGTTTPAILLTPIPGISCPVIDPAASGLIGTFLLELTGTPAMLSGTSRYLACDGPADGRVELTRR